MKLHLRLLLLLFLSILSIEISFATQDTISSNLSFDFGVTRGRNINLWPVFKRFRNDEKKELQILYPLFSKTNDFELEQKKLQVLPFYISDSSSTKINKRFLSLYYPSIFHYNKTFLDSGYVTSNKFIELAPYVSLFALSRDQNGLSVENNLLFFIWLKKDAYSTKFNVFPLYFYREDDRSRSHLLFPIYYHENYTWKNYSYSNDSLRTVTTETFSGTKNVIFPIYWAKSDKDKHYNVLFPLIFYRNTSDKKYINIFPFWWYKNDYRTYATYGDYNQKNEPTYTRKFFPIYFYRKQADSKSITVFPIVYQKEDSTHKSLTIFPIYTHGKNIETSQKYTGVFPCYWRQSSDSTSSTTYFPFYSHGFSEINNSKYQAITPLYYSISKNESQRNILFPLYWHQKSALASSTTLFPLFSYGSVKINNSKYQIITPLYYSFSDSTNKTNVLFPLYLHSKRVLVSDTIRKTTLFPVYWSTRSNEINNKILFPIVFSFKDSSYKSLTILPLYSYGISPDATKSHLGIFPIYWHQQSAQERWNVLFPLWWDNTKYAVSDTTNSKVLFPLYWQTKSKEKNSTIVFPLIYSFKNGRNHSFTAFPFYSSGHLDSLKTDYKAITPLYWKIDDPTTNKRILFPLYWQSERREEGDTIKKTTLFPIYENVTGRGVKSILLIPFYYKSLNPSYSSTSIFPIYSKGCSPDDSTAHRGYGFLYWTTKTPTKSTNTLFPIWWSRTEVFKWSKDTITKQTLLPIYWSKKSTTEQYDLLLPIYMRGHNSSTYNPKKYWGFTPLFWHTRYLNNDSTTDKTRNILFPIFWSLRSESKNYTTLFPLFYANSDKLDDESNLLITPFIGSFKDGLKKRVFIFPFYHYSHKSNRTKNTVLSILYRNIKKEDYKEWSVLWPICKKVKTASTSKFHLAPIVWYSKSDTSKMTSIQPIYYNYKSKTERTFIFSWFLYKYQNTYGYSTDHSILWKLFEKEQCVNGDFDTRILHLLYANSNKDGRIEKSLFPLYHKVSYKNGGRSTSYFLGFYNYFKEYRPQIEEFYEEDKIFWFIRIRSNYDALKAKGYDLKKGRQ